MLLDDLPFDVLYTIFASITDPGTVSACAQVNHTFKDAAIPTLYRSIWLRSPDAGYYNNASRTLREHPYLKAYVQRVHHEPHDSDIKQDVEQATDHFSLSFLSTLPNLTSYTLFLHEGTILPATYLASTMKALSHLVRLKQLNLIFDFHEVHAVCFEIPVGITALSLGRPTFDAMMHLTSQISSLHGLRILNGEELHSRLAFSQPGRLQYLTLGPNHAMTNRSLLQVLEEVPELISLNIFYDGFLNVSDNGFDVPSFQGLPRLQNLVIRHQGVGNIQDFDILFLWIELLARPSPLNALSILSDDWKVCRNPNLLIEFLKTKRDMMFINIGDVRLRGKAVSELLGSLLCLETISFFLADAKDLRACFPRAASSPKLALTTMYLRSNIANFNESNTEFSRDMIRAGRNPHLRQVFKHGHEWKALWTATPTTQRKGLDPLEDEFPWQGRMFS